MAVVRIVRKYQFAASHRLHAPSLGAARNREIYGKCNNPYGHGHDYELEVAVTGEPDPLTGRLAPLGRLDEVVKRAILEAMDRRDLNSEVEEFASMVPTTENLTRVVAARLTRAWPAEWTERVRLARVRIHETGRNIFEIEVATGAFEVEATVGALSLRSESGINKG